MRQLDPFRIELARQAYVEIALERQDALQRQRPARYTKDQHRAAEEEYRRARYGAPPAGENFFVHRQNQKERKRAA